MDERERLTIRLPAQQYEQYTAQAGDHLIGQSINLSIGLNVTVGTIVGAVVTPDRTGMMLTIEFPKGAITHG